MPILTAEERVGTTIGGKYRIERILGRGGMATVFAATDLRTGGEAAVKILHPEYAVDADVVRRFVTEARAAGSLDHPNAVRVLDSGQDSDATPYMVLELLHGETLAQLLSRKQRLTYEELLEIAGPVLDALAAAHGRGIIHRDIKPDNVFLSRDASGRTTPKLLDFGIAKVIDSARTQTATGQAIGTPYYMSPEQIEGRGAVGPPSDVWSMGVVLYQCVTGELPFFAPTLPGVFVAILTTPATPVASLARDVAPEAATVIERALTRDPAQRFATAREFAAALTAASHAVPRLRRVAAKEKSGGGGCGLAIGALVVMLLAGGGAAAFVYRDTIMDEVAVLSGTPPTTLPVAQPLVPAITPVVVTVDLGGALAPDAGTTVADDHVPIPRGPDLPQMPEGLGRPPMPFGGGGGMPFSIAEAQRVSDECHRDNDCIQERMMGMVFDQPGMNEQMAAYVVDSVVETGDESAPAIVRAYVRRYPTSARTAGYRAMLEHGLPPPTHPRRRRPSGVH